MNIIDRRPNPRDKNLSNIERFYERERMAAFKRIESDLNFGVNGPKVLGKSQIELGTTEPQWYLNPQSGKHEYVRVGNKDFVRGQDIDKEGNRDLAYPWLRRQTRDQNIFRREVDNQIFIREFFKNVALPESVRHGLAVHEQSKTWQRAGLESSGSPANMNKGVTFRKSMARRISLKRPKLSELQQLQEAAESLTAQKLLLEDSGMSSEKFESITAQLNAVTAEIEKRQKRMKIIPYIDPIDVKYNRREQASVMGSNIVVFLIMDIGETMTQLPKQLGRNFFWCMGQMIMQQHPNARPVYISYDVSARVVARQDFYGNPAATYSHASTGLNVMKRVSDKNYPKESWNIFAVQISDGNNITSDNKIAAKVMAQDILPISNLFVYIQIRSAAATGTTGLWDAYGGLRHKGLIMREMTEQMSAMSIFYDIFRKDGAVSPVRKAIIPSKDPLDLEVT